MTAELPERRRSPVWERVAGRFLDVPVATVGPAARSALGCAAVRAPAGPRVAAVIDLRRVDPSVPDPVTARAGAALYRYLCQ